MKVETLESRLRDIAVIALDSNAMPNGRLNLAEVDRLRQVLDEDEMLSHVEIWVPQPVVWEWSEHLFSSLSASDTAAKKAAKQLRNAGLAHLRAAVGLGPPLAIDEVVTAVERELEQRDIRLLRFLDAPAAAIDGLRDQVLQVGAGSRKGSAGGPHVKTGAADSASLRLLTACHAESGLVIVSADKDVAAHFNSVGAGAHTPVVVSGLWELRRALSHLFPGPEESVAQVRAALFAALPGRHSAAEATLENGRVAFPGPDDDYRNVVIAVTDVENVLAVSDIRVSRHDGFATAEASLLVELQLDGVTEDFRGDLDIISLTANAVSATAQVSASRIGDQDWQVAVDHVTVD